MKFLACNKVGHVPQVWVVVGVTMEESDQRENEETLKQTGHKGILNVNGEIILLLLPSREIVGYKTWWKYLYWH